MTLDQLKKIYHFLNPNVLVFLKLYLWFGLNIQFLFNINQKYPFAKTKTYNANVFLINYKDHT